MIVIASIHQPSTSTFNLFDKLLLLSAGKPHYFGPVEALYNHYASLGRPIPNHVNPAEFLLELTNVDFASQRDLAQNQLLQMSQAWAASPRAASLTSAIDEIEQKASHGDVELVSSSKRPSPVSLVVTLLYRSFIKSYRDVVAYGIRIAMYTGKNGPSDHNNILGSW